MLRKTLAALLLLTAASCANGPKPLATLPVQPAMPAASFTCQEWPVAELIAAPDEAEQLAVVHEDAEVAHADCGCRLFTVGLSLEKLGLIVGILGPAPYGCDVLPSPTASKNLR